MADAEKTSIWKKEITLRRKPKPAADEPRAQEAAALPPNEGEKTSIWKKEITFRRKPKGHRVPEASHPARPESVAELLRPLAGEAPPPVVAPPLSPFPAVAETEDAPGVALPPLSPPGRAAVPRETPAEPEPAAADAPVPAPEPADPGQADPGQMAPDQPASEQEPQPPKTSRKERRLARKEAESAAKAERKRAKRLAREERGHGGKRHKQLVGLKVGGSQVAAAHVVNNGVPRVLRVARAPLERGVVVGGELREPDELAAALKILFRKNKLPRSRVRLGISNNRIGVRIFDVSGIDEPKQLANAIRFRAQETVPIPLDEAVLDYRILDETVGEGGVRTRRVLVVVAHRELVDRYLAACRKAGLKLVGIDLEAFALLRALGPPAPHVSPADDAGLVVVSIGFDRSTLAVSDSRVCEFTRVLSWGGSHLDAAVARALEITPSEAEPIKLELSLDGKGEAAGLGVQKAEEARRAMRAELQAFARELVASLRFYQEQPGSLGIAEIVVTGGSAQCGGLAGELERLTGVGVRLGDPLARARAARRVRKRPSGQDGSLAVAIGLGIED